RRDARPARGRAPGAAPRARGLGVRPARLLRAGRPHRGRGDGAVPRRHARLRRRRVAGDQPRPPGGGPRHRDRTAVTTRADARPVTSGAADRLVATGAADRVVVSHAQTRPTVQLALVFLAAAALTAATGSPRWLPLHLFLAGGAVLA